MGKESPIWAGLGEGFGMRDDDGPIESLEAGGLDRSDSRVNLSIAELNEISRSDLKTEVLDSVVLLEGLEILSLWPVDFESENVFIPFRLPIAFWSICAKSVSNALAGLETCDGGCIPDLPLLIAVCGRRLAEDGGRLPGPMLLAKEALGMFREDGVRAETEEENEGLRLFIRLVPFICEMDRLRELVVPLGLGISPALSARVFRFGAGSGTDKSQRCALDLSQHSSTYVPTFCAYGL